jgi:hypothetical protein
VISDEGRNFLNFTHEMYDIITSEPPPPPPLAAGCLLALFKEYDLGVLNQLTEEGMMRRRFQPPRAEAQI